MDSKFLETIKQTNAYACLECGRCTGVCPVSRFNRQYSPRVLLTQAIRNHSEALYQDYDLWSCLTCLRCEAVCPANIRYSQLTQQIRTRAKTSGFNGKCSHAGALELLQQIMTIKDLPQNRLDWVPAQADYSTTEGEILYFVGCAPYFDAFFSDLELDILQGARSSLTLLNLLGIKPVLLPDERCCGHDLLWNGDEDHFRMLAEHNIAQVKKTKAHTLLFSCAECLSAFKNLYARYGYTVKAEMKHMSQFLAEKIAAGELTLTEPEVEITYQDPCRLGRHLDVYEAPRKVLQPNGSDHYHEMLQHERGALCCGVSAWMNCDLTSKKIQTERLRQAKATGADVLVVACPKCQIHLVCTMKDQTVREQYGLKIQDLTSLTLERVERSGRPGREQQTQAT
jgi:Fe-S oxidoreductase